MFGGVNTFFGPALWQRISFYLNTEFYLQGKEGVAFKMFMLSVTEALSNPELLQGNWSVTAADFSQHIYQKTSFLSLWLGIL